MANDEWYTPIEILDAVEEWFGDRFFDPTSSPESPSYLRAIQSFTVDDDCLITTWPRGYCRFMNMPYSGPAPFVNRLLTESTSDSWVTLSNAATSTRWAQTLLTYGAFACFCSPRIKFYRPRLTDYQIINSSTLSEDERKLIKLWVGIGGNVPMDGTKKVRKVSKEILAERSLETVWVSPSGLELVRPGSPRYDNMIVASNHGDRLDDFEHFRNSFGAFGKCVRL